MEGEEYEGMLCKHVFSKSDVQYKGLILEKVLWKVYIFLRNINTVKRQQSRTLKEKVILDSFMHF